MAKRPPCYGRHSSGQARVRIDGVVHYLGPYGSASSHQEYERLIGLWRESRTEKPRGITVRALLAAGDVAPEAGSESQIGQILSREFATMQPPRRAVVCDAVSALRSIGPVATPALIACLTEALRTDRGDDADEQLLDELQPVFDALAELLPDAPRGIAELLELLDDDYPDPFRIQLALCLSRCVSAAGEIVPALVQLGRNQDTTSRLFDAVRFALHTIGPRAVPPLIEILSASPSAVETDDACLCFAALMLGDFNSPEYPAGRVEVLAAASQSSIPALTAALVSGSPQLRLAATHALGLMGPSARHAVPALTEAIQDEDRLLRQSATSALRLITGNAD